jgi:hypothetical protein
MGLQYASFTWIRRTIPASTRYRIELTMQDIRWVCSMPVTVYLNKQSHSSQDQENGAYDAGHQMGLQYASYTWISRTIPARTRRMELTMQDTRWVCNMPAIPG